MNQNSTMNDDTIDLKELFFSLIAQWKLIAVCTLLSLICALLYIKVSKEVYAVDALVQVEDGKSAASKALLGQLGEFSGAMQKSPADAEIEILRSRMVLGQVIEKLNLNIQLIDQQDTLFHRLITTDQNKLEYSQQGILFQDNQTAFLISQFHIPESYLDKKLTLTFSKKNEFSLTDNKGFIIFKGKLNQKNSVSTSKGSWTIQINSNTPSERKFTLIKMALPTAVKALTANYSATEKGKQTGVIGLNYQGTDKEHITKVLNNILETYHAQNIERKSLESKQTLGFLDKQLPELKQKLDVAEQKFNQFRERNNTVDVTQESELMLKQSIDLETKKIELQTKQAELSAKYTSDHPMMAEINAQLSAVDQKNKELQMTLTRLPELQRQYLQLYRDVEVQTQLYTTLLNSYQQLQVAKAGEIGNVRIIDTAVEPIEPIKPKKLIVLALSLFLGGFLGTLLALLRNMLRSGVKDASQIESELDLPVYAAVPHSPIQENALKFLKKKKTAPLLALKHSDDIAIESLRSMRTAIHFALNQAKNNIIMISGPAPSIGKSFVSSNLAAIMAQNNKRVLIIDADLRRGYLHKYFHRDNQPGLTEYLNNQNTLEQVIQNTDVTNLHILTRGKNPTNPSELLSSTIFAELLQQLMPQYDHIIIDTPPVLAVTDGIIVSQYAGVNLVIARYVQTQIKELELTINRFEQAGSKVNGFILNDIQRSAGGYGYGYGYGYNYAYNYKAKEKD